MTKQPEIPTKCFARVVTALFVLLLIPGVSQAYSAVAWVDGYIIKTSYAGWNFNNQKAADAAALDGCRNAGKANGLAKLASKCKVMHRQKAPGGGAIVCGKVGCITITNRGTQQEAINEAYQQCESHGYGDCKKTEITSWWDDAGYGRQSVKNDPPGKTCGPPLGRTVRSTYECNNGDCTRTFENGCTVRFQAPYCHDQFSGKWEWKPDGC